MLANLPKRLLADPWELETTTAYSPGEGSVAEETAAYARAVAEGRVKDSRLFFFHRQASDYDLADPAQLRQAVLEAAGPTAPWRDIEGICDQWQDPEADRAYLERVYLNRPVQAAAQAFDAVQWGTLARPEYHIPDGALVVGGFDGALYHDATAFVITEVETGFQEPFGIWENPGIPNWEVPAGDVDAAVEEAFRRFQFWKLYGDPYYWEGWLAKWQGRHPGKVVEWRTNRIAPMAYALKAYRTAMQTGEVTHNGDRVLARHIGNACRTNTNYRDDQGEPMWLIRKEQPDSPNKIDAAMAGCLSWEARNDAIADGARVEALVGHGIYVPGDEEDDT